MTAMPQPSEVQIRLVQADTPALLDAARAAVAGHELAATAGVTAPQGMSVDRSANSGGGFVSSGVAGLQPGSSGASSVQSPAGERVLIRDAELDRYLAAHKQYSGTSALAVPGGAVRNAAATAPGR